MPMDRASVADAVKQICEEKGIPFETVIEIIEAALAAAYRKDFGEKNQNVKVEFDLDSGTSKIFDVKTVVEDVPEEELAAQQAEEVTNESMPTKPHHRVEEVAVEGAEEKHRFNSKTELQISDAKKIKKGSEVGDIIKTELETPADFGRMAAQTAKQVITQKIRETEREAMYKEYKDKEGQIVVGTVQRQEGRLVLIDMGRLTALLPPEEQINGERCIPGAHVKVYVVSVTATSKGPEVIVSRSHSDIVRKLFAIEIPEISSGVVVVKGIAREAGSRTKIAVWTDQENIDPIGSCIGQRGARIQTIISELKGEKVDIIKYSDDPVEYITNALSPAKIIGITIDEATRTAQAKVVEDQLSLAIGKAGQNVRLAAKLTGWKINISSDAAPAAEGEAVTESTAEVSAESTTDTPVVVPEEAGAAVAEKPKKKVKKAVKKADKEVVAEVAAGQAEPETPAETPAEKVDVASEEK